jgi:hypothetical protein
MITKIKNTVQSIPKLKNILEGVVKLEAINDLLNVISLSIDENTAKSEPMKATHKVEQTFAVWETMKYWHFMTKDIFWSGILLNTSPKMLK